MRPWRLNPGLKLLDDGVENLLAGLVGAVRSAHGDRDRHHSVRCAGATLPGSPTGQGVYRRHAELADQVAAGLVRSPTPLKRGPRQLADAIGMPRHDLTHQAVDLACRRVLPRCLRQARGEVGLLRQRPSGLPIGTEARAGDGWLHGYVLPAVFAD